MTDPSHAAYAAAHAALAAKGRSFHWARRLLGAVHADRATRLYGFCRRVDDLADETQSPDAARAALFALGQSLRAGASRDPLTADTIRLLQDCQIDPTIPLELIRGVAGDLLPVRVADKAELLRYCYRVAGTVGLMMSAALDVMDPRALQHAIDLGIAMPLTNLCRDVREDALADRRYLPAFLVGDIDPARLIQPTEADRPTVCSAIATLLDLADVYYRSGEDGLAYLPANARGSILVAARIYHAIGARLRRRDYDYWSSRAWVPMGDKAVITAKVLAAAPFRRASRRVPRLHDPALHRPLAGLLGINPRMDKLNAA